MSLSLSRLDQLASQLRDAIREEAMLNERRQEISQENEDITNRLIALATIIEQLRESILEEAANPKDQHHDPTPEQGHCS